MSMDPRSRGYEDAASVAEGVSVTPRSKEGMDRSMRHALCEAGLPMTWPPASSEYPRFRPLLKLLQV